MSEQRRYLTKTRFKLATECPAKLFYTGKPDYPNSRDEDEFIQSLAEGGFQLGELAKLHYPNGFEINSTEQDAMLEDTRQALQSDAVTLFEPALAYERLFIRVDILQKIGNKIRLLEVKSKSYDGSDSNYFRGVNGTLKRNVYPYLLDIAFQTYVARKALPGYTITPFLVMPDKSRRATVDGLNRLFPIKKLEGSKNKVCCQPVIGITRSDLGDSVLTEIDVSDYVEEILSSSLSFPGVTGSLADLAHTWSIQYEDNQRIAAPIGGQCKGCEFRSDAIAPHKSGLHECWSRTPGMPVERLGGALVIDLCYGTKAGEWIKDGKYLLDQIAKEDIGPETIEDGGLTRTNRQWMQISRSGLNARGFYFNTELARKEMQAWSYPLNLIDFETSRTALPYFKGSSPYALVAFQYSHHVLHEDGRLEHAGDFLCTDPGTYPNLEFLRALRSALTVNQGTVMMWSPYENAVLNNLRQQLAMGDPGDPEMKELISFIDELTIRKTRSVIVHRGRRAMYDLSVLASKAFFHEKTSGSSSIKKVLPAMLQASDFLRKTYSDAIYGGGNSNGRNFYEPMAWWQLSPDNVPLDPYALLPNVFSDIKTPVTKDDEDYSVNQGGAAAIAYTRLQCESLSEDIRKAWERSLLKYCELDTLAMAMVVQGWRDWIHNPPDLPSPS